MFLTPSTLFNEILSRFSWTIDLADDELGTEILDQLENLDARVAGPIGPVPDSSDIGAGRSPG